MQTSTASLEHTMANSKETPINRKTFRFVPNRKPGVKINCTISSELHKQIHRLACHEGISIGKAIERMCRTDQAQALVPNTMSKLYSNAKSTSKRAIDRLFKTRP